MSYLKGKSIWLTGASSGIGRALAVELVTRGARLALTSRNAEQLDELASELRSQGGDVRVFPGDVLNGERLKEVYAAVVDAFGQLDILISNAGTHIFTVPERFDAKEYLGIMDLNFGGMVRCLDAVAGDMVRRKSGHIVAIASLAGYRGLPRAAAYGASKAAMINFLESIRFHLRRHGIVVTIVNPGFVKTPLTDKNDFPMPFLIDAHSSARLICDGLERRRYEIAFPRPFNWILKLGRVLPYKIYECIVDRLW